MKIVGYIIIFILFIALIGFVFKNILGFIGLGLAVWGIYKWKKNRGNKAPVKILALLTIFGVIVTFGWMVHAATTTSVKPVVAATPAGQDPAKQAAATSRPGATTKEPDPVANSTLPAATNLISAHVAEVVDGDTLKATFNGKEETIRLLLVDTPETKKPNTPIEPYGPESSQYAKETLNGKDIRLEIGTSERDKYGRLLAYVWLGNKTFNEMLLEKGFARVAYVYPPNVKYVDEYRTVQKQAQQKGLGIWSIENYVQEDGFNLDAVKSSTSPTAKSSNSHTTTGSTQVQSPAPTGNNSNVYFKRCADARAAGAAPLHRGDPGYRPALDRDNDGIACE
jgi:micrococcal nuclease